MLRKAKGAVFTVFVDFCTFLSNGKLIAVSNFMIARSLLETVGEKWTCQLSLAIRFD